MDEDTRKMLVVVGQVCVKAVKELDRRDAEIDALHAEIDHLKAMAGEKK